MLGKIEGGSEVGDRGWAGWMASLTQWTWVWASSRSWWQTGRPGVLQSMGSQRVGHECVTELNWSSLQHYLQYLRYGKNLKCPLIDEWIKQIWYNIHNEILLSHKKWNLAICTTWIDLEGNMLRKIGQTEEDKSHTISPICGILKTKQMNKQNKRESDS